MRRDSLQAFADEQLESYEIFRTCMLRQALQNFIHTALRDALQRWFSMYRQEIERGLKIQTSLVIRSVLMQASTHTVLLRALLEWRRHADDICHLSQSSGYACEIRHLESLCVQLKVQRAEEAYLFLEKK